MPTETVSSTAVTRPSAHTDVLAVPRTHAQSAYPTRVHTARSLSGRKHGGQEGKERQGDGA